MVLPVASTVLPASSRMRGVGLEGAWNLVCEEEGGKENFTFLTSQGQFCTTNCCKHTPYTHSQTYLSPGFPRPESCSVCVSVKKSHSGKIKDSK